MNEQYYKICEKILGKYTNDNKYEQQFLYLICYLGGDDLTETKLKEIVKRLCKKMKKHEDVIYNILCSEIKKKLYPEDFLIRASVFHNEICYNKGEIDIRTGIKRKKILLIKLWIICSLYNKFEVNINVLEKKENSYNRRKIHKKIGTRKDNKRLENKIKKGIYTYIRERIIRFGKKDESI
jgi:hypothetical protein